MDQDLQLIQRFQGGAADAFGGLYDRYIRKIYSFIYYRTGHKETAEDLTSKVFMKALEKLDQFNTATGTFQAWLYRIARNTVIDHYRTDKHADDLDALNDIGTTPNVAGALDAKQSVEEVTRYLQKLNPDQRDIVMLRVFDELSYKEIADITGKSEASCKMTFSRTISKLRSELKFILIVSVLIIWMSA